MRLTASARTTASPAQVWEVLGEPARWPEFELFLRRVRGTHRSVSAGQTLVGVARFGALAVPIDVREVVAGSRLVLRVQLAPGVRQTLSFDVVPVVGGGSDLRLGVVVDGVFARAAVGPVWLAAACTLHLLAARADRIERSGRRAA